MFATNLIKNTNQGLEIEAKVNYYTKYEEYLEFKSSEA